MRYLVKIEDLIQDFEKYAIRVTQEGYTILIERSQDENLVILTEFEYNRLSEEMRQKSSAKALETLQAVQEESVINGTDKMTMDEINEEIRAYRRERKERDKK